MSGTTATLERQSSQAQPGIAARRPRDLHVAPKNSVTTTAFAAILAGRVPKPIDPNFSF
jgi:hypothetical protein